MDYNLAGLLVQSFEILTSKLKAIWETAYIGL
jgi:hypothetical protein